MKINTADTIGIWNDISDYLSMTVDVLKMAIQILDHDRFVAGVKKNQYTPYDGQLHRTDHSGHHVAVFLLLRWSLRLSLVGPRKSLEQKRGESSSQTPNAIRCGGGKCTHHPSSSQANGLWLLLARWCPTTRWSRSLVYSHVAHLNIGLFFLGFPDTTKHR